MIQNLVVSIVAMLHIAGSGPLDPRERVPNLCHAGEQTIFTCTVGRKVASICASDIRSHRGRVQYRYGTARKIELAYPEHNASGSRLKFRGSDMGYSGGGEEHIRFSNGNTEYTAYYDLQGGSFDNEHRREHWDEAGIVVKRGGRKIADLKCKAPERSTIVLDGLPEEKFIPRE